MPMVHFHVKPEQGRHKELYGRKDTDFKGLLEAVVLDSQMMVFQVLTNATVLVKKPWS